MSKPLGDLLDMDCAAGLKKLRTKKGVEAMTKKMKEEKNFSMFSKLSKKQVEHMIKSKDFATGFIKECEETKKMLNALSKMVKGLTKKTKTVKTKTRKN